MSGRQLHPRHAVVQSAEGRLVATIAKLLGELDLTEGETLAVLLRAHATIRLLAERDALESERDAERARADAAEARAREAEDEESRRAAVAEDAAKLCIVERDSTILMVDPAYPEDTFIVLARGVTEADRAVILDGVRTMVACAIECAAVRDRRRADAAEKRVAMLRAEVEMLRGVGCSEDGDGPCGACLKCARAEVARLREALEKAAVAMQRASQADVTQYLPDAIDAIDAALAKGGGAADGVGVVDDTNTFLTPGGEPPPGWPNGGG